MRSGRKYKMSEEALHIKEEPEWDTADSCGVSEAAAQAGLYADHVVKNEVVVGPARLQPRDIEFALRALNVNTGCKLEHVQADKPFLKACCVSLERCIHLEMLLRKRALKLEAVAATVRELPQPMLRDCYVRLERIHNLEALLVLGNQFTALASSTSHIGRARGDTYPQTNSSDEYTSYSCDICGHEFESKYSLHIHVREHAATELYTCAVCKKLFTDSDALLGHRQIHMGKKPYFCKVCGKQFTRSSDFIVHKRIHTGDTFPYKCAKTGFSRQVI